LHGEELAKKGLAKALERKMGQDEGILTNIETKAVESSLLMNVSRLRIFEYVCNNPGYHLRQISRALNFSAQTVRWHLAKLIQKELISHDSFGGKKIFFPLRNYIRADVGKLLALLNNEDIKRLYLFIESKSHLTQKQMESELGVYQQLLSRSLLILERHGLITNEKRNRKKTYFITDKISEIERKYEAKASDFEKKLVKALDIDGVDPKIIKSGSKLLEIEIDSGGTGHSILKIQKNPVRAVLRD
jgi:DNA-binding MarR family transcriptional regulator